MVDRKEPTTVKTRSVYAVAIAAILGACVFVILSPELFSLATGGPPMFKRGDHVRAKHDNWYSHEWIVDGEVGDFSQGRYFRLIAADEDTDYLWEYHSFERDLIPAAAPIPPRPEDATSADKAQAD